MAVCFIGIFAFVACGTNVSTNDSTKDISVTGSDGTVYNSYQTACSKGDFDAARDYVGKMKEQLIVVKAEGDYKMKQAFEKAVQEAEHYVQNEEIQYLASMNDEQANNRLILMLNQRPIDGLEAAENFCLGIKIWKSDIEDPDVTRNVELKNFKKYIAWCSNHNSKCTSLLNIAIACGNKGLAQKIIHVFRPDPELSIKIKENGYEYDVYAHYTNTSIEAAQKKYDEAVKSGAFN